MINSVFSFIDQYELDVFCVDALKRRVQNPENMLEFLFARRYHLNAATIARMLNLSLSLFSVLHPEALMKNIHVVFPADCRKVKRYEKAFAKECENGVRHLI